MSEIHRLDLQAWRAEKVVDEKRYVREFAATLDGKRLAMITAADDSVIRSEGGSRVDVWDADGGKVTPTDEGWRKTAASPWPWLESLAWNPDGTRLAFSTIFDAYPAEIIVEELFDGFWTAGRMKRGDVQVQGYGTPLQWGKDAIWFHGERAGRLIHELLTPDHFNPVKPSPEGKRQHFVEGSKIIENPLVGVAEDPRLISLTLTDMGREGFVTLRAKPSDFPNLYDEPREHFDMPRKLTHLNPQSDTWKLPTVQHVTWKAPDGTEVGGVLELPPGYKKGEKLPLVVAIHGGPTTSTKAELAFDPHNGRLYLSARGYAVLCPNYRGSTGYGDKFVTDLIGNENDIEVKDILAGIQHLINEGIADPERIGVMGWSNGGYLTNCLIAMKDSPVKIKAASSGAGILDTVAEWGFNDEPAYPTVFKKGLPWETPDIYRKTSPTYGLGNVTTPTLIHVGGNDVRCPPG